MTADGPVVWLVIWLALEALRHGVQVVGSPGAGKSVLLKALRGSLASLIHSRPTCDIYLVDFDSKRDLHAIHAAFPEFCPVFDLNPFLWTDKYDPFGDVDDPRDIAELVAQMIEVGTNSTQPFFPQAARLVERGMATRHWLAARDRVDFADLVLSGNSPDRMRMVLGSHSLTRGHLALINDTEAGLSVMATLLNEVSKFDSVAALMRTNTRGRAVSIRSLLRNRFSVLSLPYDDKSVEVLAAFTRLILTRLQQTLLAENRPNRYVVVLLDELALIPRGVDLRLGSVKGREAGWIPVFSYQGPTIAREAFSRDKFDAAVSPLKTLVVLNLPDRTDAEWASKRLSDHQGWMRIESASGPKWSPGAPATSGWSEHFVTLDNWTPSDIQSLPVPTPANPVIEGIMLTMPFKPFKFRIHIPTLLDQLVPKVPPKAPAAPRDPKDFILTGWTDADLRRLRLMP